VTVKKTKASEVRTRWLFFTAVKKTRWVTQRVSFLTLSFQRGVFPPASPAREDPELVSVPPSIGEILPLQRTFYLLRLVVANGGYRLALRRFFAKNGISTICKEKKNQ